MLALALDQEREGGALGGIKGELADELAGGREFDQLAREARIAIDGVIVGGEQVAVGSQREADGAAKVSGIVIHQAHPFRCRRESLPRA